MNSTAYVLGIIFGLIISILLAILLIRFCQKGQSKKPEYDERQYFARLKSFRVGFWSMSFCIAMMIVLSIAGVDLPMMSAVKYFIPFFFGTIGMVSYGIWTDGYWGMYTNKKRFIILMSGVTVVNLVIPIISWSEDSLFNKDGLIGLYMIEFLVGIMVLILLVQILLKEYIDRTIDENVSKGDDE